MAEAAGRRPDETSSEQSQKQGPETWSLTLVILSAKGLRPELRPIFSGATLAIIVLIEPVFSTFDIEHFEAIEIGNSLSAFILLVKANDHTKGVIV